MNDLTQILRTIPSRPIEDVILDLRIDILKREIGLVETLSRGLDKVKKTEEERREELG